MFLPGAFDAERAEIGGFALVEIVFDKMIDPAAARAAAEAGAEFGEVFDSASYDYLDIPVFRVAHPAAQVEFAGFAMDKPAESHALHPAANEKVKHH